MEKKCDIKWVGFHSTFQLFHLSNQPILCHNETKLKEENLILLFPDIVSGLCKYYLVYVLIKGEFQLGPHV